MSKTYESWRQYKRSGALEKNIFRLFINAVHPSVQDQATLWMKDAPKSLIHRKKPFDEIPCKIIFGSVPKQILCETWPNQKFLQYCLKHHLFVPFSRFKALASPKKVLCVEDEIINVYSTIKQLERNDRIKYPVFLEEHENKCFIYHEEKKLENLRFALLCDSLTHPLFSRKQIDDISPVLFDQILHGSNIRAFAALKALLKWICVTRERGKGLCSPDQSYFSIYRYICEFVSILVEKDELEPMRSYSSQTKGGYFKGQPPVFLQQLRAFLQLNRVHYISGEILMSLWCEFNVDEELRKTFPQVFELISLLLTTKNHLNPSIEIPFIEGKIPHHVFLYGFALHQKVPLKMRKKILKNIHLKEVHKIPRKMKKSFVSSSIPKREPISSKQQHFLEILSNIEQCSRQHKKDRVRLIKRAGRKNWEPRPLSEIWIVRTCQLLSSSLNKTDFEMIYIENEYHTEKE